MKLTIRSNFMSVVRRSAGSFARLAATLALVLLVATMYASCSDSDDDDETATATESSIYIEEQREWATGVSAYSWNSPGGAARISMVIDEFHHGDMRLEVFDAVGTEIYQDLFLSSDWYWYIDGEYTVVDFTDAGVAGAWTIILTYSEFTGDVSLLIEVTTDTDPDVPEPPDTSDLLDTSFSGDGRVSYTDESSTGKSVKIDSAGRIIVCGTKVDSSTGFRQLAVWRYTSAGTLDTSFNSDGIFLFTSSVYDDSAGFDVAIDSSNRVVACGWAADSAVRTDLVVLRLTVTGALDTAFSADGIAIIDQGEDEVGMGDAVDSGGLVLVTGTTLDDATTAGAAFVARFTDAGVPDVTFGTVGIATTSDASDRGVDVGVDQFDRPLLLGLRDEDLAIWKFETDGDPETAFGTAGVITSPGLANEFRAGRSLLVHSDDSIAVAGLRYFEDGTDPVDMLLWRFESDGDPLAAFNGTGIVAYSYPGGLAAGKDVAIDGTGRVLVVGVTKSTGTVDASATCWRYDTAGSIDTTLAGSGGTGVARFDLRDGNAGTKSNSITITGGGLTYVSGSAFDRDTNTNELHIWKLDP